LPEEIESRLENLAKETGRTKTFYARKAILEYIEDLEDLYLAKKRLSDIQKGKTKTIKLNLLESELGSVC
jgi:RHH-type rel operon transcriptional repressor/antitoxin RelB